MPLPPDPGFSTLEERHREEHSPEETSVPLLAEARRTLGTYSSEEVTLNPTKPRGTYAGKESQLPNWTLPQDLRAGQSDPGHGTIVGTPAHGAVGERDEGRRVVSPRGGSLAIGERDDKTQKRLAHLRYQPGSSLEVRGNPLNRPAALRSKPAFSLELREP